MRDYTKQLKAFTVLLRAANAVQEASRQDISQYELNVTEFAVLEFLYHKGDQPIQVIGKKVLIASSSITYVVDKLEKRGLVQRIACPNDRRVTFASLTVEGKKFLACIFPQHEEKVAQIFDVLTDEELAVFTELTKKIGLHSAHH